MTDALMHTYARLPLTFVRGEGAWLWDTEGQRYFDLISGIGVCALGHGHPKIVETICNQARQLIHTSNLYHIEAQALLAERLVELSQMERAFFCNSGAEANETAIKIARSFGHARGVDAPEIIVAEGSFHGRTLATLSATASRKVQAGFEPLVKGFVRVPYNDPDAIVRVARNNPNVVAVLLEPIQGEGGINVPDETYLPAVRQVCDEQGWLLILDEVQTGMARTGKWFAWQHTGAIPDLMTVAKALGNGFPIGACLGRGMAAELLRPGSHASTFGGNPLACRVALSVLEAMASEALPAHAAQAGQRLMTGLSEALRGIQGVLDVRGRGLMIAIELDRPCLDVVTVAVQHRLLVNVTAERIVRLLPPLILDDTEVALAVQGVRNVIVQSNAAQG